jgi:ribonuclease HII
VSVGVAVVTPAVGTAPRGLRDSKLLTARARRDLLPRLRRWAVASAVGHADPYEVDAVGIIAALRIAASRAFAQIEVPVDVALLDGSHDWLSVPAEPDALFPDPRSSVAAQLADLSVLPGRVVTRVKADLTCAGVAAASVLAKCERDAIMVGLASEHPQYGWALNKGYSAPDHIDALRRHGPTPLHRRSWNLPGVGGSIADPVGVAANVAGMVGDASVDLCGPGTGRGGDLSTASR